jgi:hypothetical protein
MAARLTAALLTRASSRIPARPATGAGQERPAPAVLSGSFSFLAEQNWRVATDSDGHNNCAMPL